MAKKGRKDKARKNPSSDQQERVPVDRDARAPDSEPVADLEAPPAPGSRRWSNALIALFLAYQVLMPLRYYLGGRGYDERFSWRMFSTLRLQDCKVEVSERSGGEDRRVNLQKTVQLAWIGMLERYRQPVVDKLLARRCTEPDVRAVSYERRCTDTDGSTLPKTTVVRDCTSGQQDVHQDAPGAEHDSAQGAAP